MKSNRLAIKVMDPRQSTLPQAFVDQVAFEHFGLNGKFVALSGERDINRESSFIVNG
jgi:hypothetical protein